jgi:uncharacterized protein (DUF2147 family)
MRTLVVLVLLASIAMHVSAQTAAVAAPAATAASPVGLWLNQDKDSHIEVFATTNGSLSGKIVWITPSRVNDPTTGKPSLDTENPDPKLRSRAVLGLTIMSGFVKEKGSDTEWKNGVIYDPNDGKTYSCLMRLKSPNELDIRGYVGVSWLGRTEKWTRVK